MKKESRKQNRRKVQKTKTEISGFIKIAISESRSLAKDIIRDRYVPSSEIPVSKKNLYWDEIYR